MADIEELIGMLQNPGDDELPDTIYDDLRNAHTSAVDHVATTSQAKIEELTTALSDREAQIQKLKSDNWDLFEQIPKAGDDEPGDGVESDTEEQTLDDLIVDVEE